MRPGVRPAELAVALLAGVAGVAGSYVAAGGTRAFVAAPLSALVVRLAPASVVATSITTMGDLASRLSFAAALALAVGLYALLVLAGLRAGRRSEVPQTGAVAAAFGVLFVTTLLTGAFWRSVSAAAPVLAVVALAATSRTAPEGFSPSRRAVTTLAAGVAGFAAFSYLRGGDSESSSVPALGLDEGGRSAIDARLADARERSLDVAGIPGLVSPIEEFYEVDISNVNPQVRAEGWELRVTGAVENELAFTYDDLRAREPEHRFNTLRCVGESLNGHKMDNALWTGVPIGPLLEEAGPRGGCECVMLRAADGYFEEFPLAALRRGFLAYGMNGHALPRKHGHPVRALIPGHWGEINVKWLTEIELLEREADGYWEKRGWHGTGPVNTVAKLHAVNHGEGRVEIGGHAYAGTRGIERVEVSIDDGDWREAELSAPLPDEDVWRQWRYEWSPETDVKVMVRAIESDGTVQPRAEAGAFPSGSSGWVTRRIDPP